ELPIVWWFWMQGFAVDHPMNEAIGNPPRRVAMIVGAHRDRGANATRFPLCSHGVEPEPQPRFSMFERNVSARRQNGSFGILSSRRELAAHHGGLVVHDGVLPPHDVDLSGTNTNEQSREYEHPPIGRRVGILLLATLFDHWCCRRGCRLTARGATRADRWRG